LAGKLRRAFYNGVVNKNADRHVSSVDAMCACFIVETTPLRKSTPLMNDYSIDDGSTREHPCSSNYRRIEPQAEHQMILVEKRDENDGDDNRNDRTNDWRDSRRRPTGGSDDYARSSKPSGSSGIARDEM
jgi:hypothetical protein